MLSPPPFSNEAGSAGAEQAQNSARDSSPLVANRVRRPHAAIVGALLTLVIIVAAFPSYRWWRDGRTESFKKACVRAVEEKSWEQLEAIALRWTEWEPSNGDGWVYLAEASVQLGEVERAADALGRVSNSYHGALEALALRGELLFADLNRPLEAVETWQRMLAINARADVARQRLIYFYSMSLQRAKMLEHIRKAMDLECEPPESYAYFLLANELNFSDGLSVVAKWRETYPNEEALEVAHAIYKA